MSIDQPDFGFAMLGPNRLPSIWERRSILSNNGKTPAWTNRTGKNRFSKFFPRGCRGFIDTIDVYCYDAGVAGGTITVYISVQPSMGYTATANVVVPPGGAAAWRSANFDRMWNYDSLFIFVVGSTADMKWAYDVAIPYDGYSSADDGATWIHENHRMWFRVVMKGETAGDVPVSGTINNIEIPNEGVSSGLVNLPAVAQGTTQYDNERFGSGKILFVMYDPVGAGGRDNMCPRLMVDGVEKFPGMNYAASDWYLRVKENSKGLFFGAYVDADNFWTFIIKLDIPFRRSFKVGYYNKPLAGNQAGNIFYFWTKI